MSLLASVVLVGMIAFAAAAVIAIIASEMLAAFRQDERDGGAARWLRTDVALADALARSRGENLDGSPRRAGLHAHRPIEEQARFVFPDVADDTTDDEPGLDRPNARDAA